MTRVVSATVIGAGVHRLAAAPPDRHDPIVRQLVEQATAEAYERGLRDGRDHGRAEAREATAEQVSRLGASVVAALEATGQQVRAAGDELIESSFELAVAMAEAILGVEPHDGGTVIAARVRDALARMEDTTPVVVAHPDDVEVLSAALADQRDVTVAADPGLAPGEARIRGGWAKADLTRAAAFAAVRRELGVD
jgi:flagellar biosynthesis/type III secretory pathway protein FliH